MLYLGDHSSSSWWLLEASHQHSVAGARTAVMIQSTVPRLNYQTLQQYISPRQSPVVYILYIIYVLYYNFALRTVRVSLFP